MRQPLETTQCLAHSKHPVNGDSQKASHPTPSSSPLLQATCFTPTHTQSHKQFHIGDQNRILNNLKHQLLLVYSFHIKCCVIIFTRLVPTKNTKKNKHI